MAASVTEARPIRVLALGGSLRAGAFSTRLLEAMVEIAAPRLAVELHGGLELLPYFNQDDEGEESAPESVRQLREQLREADALLIVTPEYNRSVPATIKNALDWCSRPHGSGSLLGKPVAIVAASPGPSGGLLALHHLRQVVHAAGAVTVGTKELAIPSVYKCFDADGAFADETVRGWLAQLLAELRASVVVPAADYARVDGEGWSL
jgi:chromate reductase